MDNEKRELSLDEMDKVSGGATKPRNQTVETRSDFKNPTRTLGGGKKQQGVSKDAPIQNPRQGVTA